MQSDGYLKKEAAWENVRKNIEAANQAGLQLWVADDNGYPSGMAGGQLVEADPAFEVRGLRQMVKEGSGLGPVRLDLPKEAERFVQALLCPVLDGLPVLEKATLVPVQPDRVEAEGVAGPWKLYAFAVQVNREGTQARSTEEQFKTNGPLRQSAQSCGDGEICGHDPRGVRAALRSPEREGHRLLRQ